MITGHLHQPIPSWYPQALKEVLTAAQSMNFHSLPEGKHEFGERGIFFMLDIYETRQKGDSLPESHQKYVDVQLMLQGEEILGSSMDFSQFEVELPYNPEKDITFYRDCNGLDDINFKEGMYIVLFPHDIHMPGQFAQNCSQHLCKKVVFKIPLEALI